jgi:sulfite exporter TauE/SafE
MSGELASLLSAATAIGFFHTLLGPDHYIPFIVMSKARNWPIGKTGAITFLCGLGHVASSVVLGAIGISAGIALKHLEITESVRGEIAGWLLLAFGIVYFVWGVRRAVRNKPHTHVHAHADGSSHEHEHTHHTVHLHAHAAENPSLTPWVLFAIFVFGPCEPLIPLLMYPAAAESAWSVFLVAGTFSFVTIGTMLTVVLCASRGMALLPMKRLERYSHALAGAAIAICGIAITCGL